ncbi:hypothetical protein DFJ74DRAFT_766154 [Hyaloraphidium curvatum]|nr:hypothetical protein DFJ74DRAFT_766154 [Hyaloraphidium curvatum]
MAARRDAGAAPRVRPAAAIRVALLALLLAPHLGAIAAPHASKAAAQPAMAARTAPVFAPFAAKKHKGGEDPPKEDPPAGDPPKEDPPTTDPPRNLYNWLDDAFATGGLVCWTLQPIPQIIKNYRDSSTYGLSPWLFLTWSIASFFGEGSYSIALKLPLGLVLQGLLGGWMLSVCLGQCLHYSFGWGIGSSWAFTSAYIAALSVASYFVGIWLGTQDEAFESVWGSAIVGLNAFGLLTQYWEIIKLKRVLGTSSFFLALDIVGGILSMLSLVFHYLARPENPFEWIYFFNFGAIVVLEAGIAILYAWVEGCGRREIEEDEALEKALEIEKAGIEGETTDLLGPESISASREGEAEPAESTPLLPEARKPPRPRVVRSSTLPHTGAAIAIAVPQQPMPADHPMHATFRARPAGFVGEGPVMRADDIRKLIEEADVEEEKIVARMDPRRGRAMVRRRNTVDKGTGQEGAPAPRAARTGTGGSDRPPAPEAGRAARTGTGGSDRPPAPEAGSSTGA